LLDSTLCCKQSFRAKKLIQEQNPQIGTVGKPCYWLACTFIKGRRSMSRDRRNDWRGTCRPDRVGS
ncbi:MAG: hypothetical protein AAGB19_16470, partial [Cyanobacteria bacterium P01_F01_bin.3]